jgi:hypothetical protein
METLSEVWWHLIAGIIVQDVDRKPMSRLRLKLRLKLRLDGSESYTDVAPCRVAVVGDDTIRLWRVIRHGAAVCHIIIRHVNGRDVALNLLCIVSIGPW